MEDFTMTAPAITLYGTALSGHCHRVALLLRMLDLDYRQVDASAAVRATPEFRRLNPFGQIPVLTDGELVLADSNAILVYLARRYAPASGWLPDEPESAARVQRWLSIAAGELRYGPATARVALLWGNGERDENAIRIARRLFDFMEGALADEGFLAAGHPTVADLACYSYTAHAPEGGIALDPWPRLRAWLARVEALPGFVPMPRSQPKVA